MELEMIMLSKISQNHKDKYHMFHNCGSLKEKEKVHESKKEVYSGDKSRLEKGERRKGDKKE
jgi:hypothetical protein